MSPSDPIIHAASEAADAPKFLRFLHLEDNVHDRELLFSRLHSAGFLFEMTYAKSREEYEQALDRSQFDVILSDFSLPAFDGSAALAMGMEKQPDAAFIFVSGTIGEERAIENVKAGATDYVLKEHLDRLVPVVRRALREVTARNERRLSDEKARVDAARNLRQLNALIAFTGDAARRPGHLMDTIQWLTKTAAETLEVARVSVWKYNAERTAIRCINLYELAENRHSQGAELISADYPAYFRALAECNVIAAHDAISDPQTCEFAEHYLKPLGIASLLDAPVHLGGVKEGVLCSEHVGESRQWQSDEETFAVALANLVSLALEEDERKQAEARLLENATRLAEQATLLDKAQDAIVVRNLEHGILFWNQSAERLYGYTADEVAGSSIKDLLYDDPADFLAATAATVENGEWIGEITQLTRAKSKLIVEGRWTLVRDDAGNPKSILCINTDITERKKIEQQFLRAQRMEGIGTLAGGIAHDLNNCLAPIIMSLDLMKMRFSDHTSQEMLSTVEVSARRGAEMVQQVLSFARGMEGRRIEVQVKHLLREISKLVSETFVKNIHIKSDVIKDLWTVNGDPTQLHQVLLNLCINARDAMPDGGDLILSAQNLEIDSQYAALDSELQAGRWILIQVEDTGSGVPPEIQEKIFDPFFTTKAISHGTGLGLSTSMAIVKSHGGLMRVYSEVGHGTTFKVYLPVHAETFEDANGEDKAELDLPRGNDEMILVVDDEATVREITRQTLEAFGYRVVTAQNGAEAAAVYAGRREEIAVVLTDMQMPVMDGLSTIQVLRTMNPAVRIIGASGLSTNAHLAEAGIPGLKHFLHKPFATSTLLGVLKETLSDSC